MADLPELNWRERLLVRVVQAWIVFTGWTVRLEWKGKENLFALQQQQQPFLLCAWHQDIYFSAWILRGQNLAALISSSKDGEYIHQVLRGFGFSAVRGSSTRGGLGAMKQMIKCLKAPQPVAITPDGPLGPAFVVQEGIISLARKTGVPILPWRYEASSCWRLKSWDRHKIPRPFAAIQSVVGTPFEVPSDLSAEEIPEYCRKLEAVMGNLLPSQ